MTGAAAPRAGEHALVWPVKESFLAYVNRTGGRITIVAPAYPGTDGFAFPHVPGGDGTGTIEALGPGVAGLKTGARVVLNPGISCGRCEFCRKGEQSLCVGLSEIVGPGFAGRMELNRPGRPWHLITILLSLPTGEALPGREVSLVINLSSTCPRAGPNSGLQRVTGRHGRGPKTCSDQHKRQ